MPQAERPPLQGLLVIDKPAGLTSHDVVSRVRRMTGIRRVGHAGTLDPFATGVLVVAVGQATRLLRFAQASDKGYRAHIVLGAETDTLDVDGKLVRAAEPGEWPSRTEIEEVLRRFIGEVDQLPPAHAAIKVGGRKLYELARAGTEVVVAPRRVRIDAIEVRSYEPPDLVLDIRCGSGTYIRSLARDIGEALDTGAYCHALRRTQTGAFCLGDAWTLDELEERDLVECWPEVALHPDAALRGMPAVVLNERDAEAWYHGRSATLPPSDVAGEVRAYAPDGTFLGVGSLDAHGRLQPSIVMRRSEGDVTE